VENRPQTYSDRIVADFLTFGWPINYRSAVFPERSSSNHSSAVCFPDTIDSFLLTELKHVVRIKDVFIVQRGVRKAIRTFIRLSHDGIALSC